ncbi:MAG: flagellar basal body-associated FliL family protein [candidate division KSB1 bacterium]|nr:flagellar basal body-associated FliL family protein [candidate division KSB1 bacterium]
MLTRLLIGLAALAVQAGLAYAVMVLVVLPAAEKRLAPQQQEQKPPAQAKTQGNKTQEGTAKEATPTEPLADLRIESMFSVEDLVVNPAFSGGERYLVLSLVFISDTKETQKEIEQKLPIIQDKLNTLLSRKGVWWYSNSDNREVLREEIRSAVNELLRTGRVTRVLFTKYVVQ